MCKLWTIETSIVTVTGVNINDVKLDKPGLDILKLDEYQLEMRSERDYDDNFRSSGDSHGQGWHAKENQDI